MSTRTDALLSQQETGKITASIILVMPGCHPALALTSEVFSRSQPIKHEADAKF
jgi:hypothetical protein